MKTEKIKIIDLFAGIGGIRLGFEQAYGDDAECVFTSEIDKNAQRTYVENFGGEVYGDITQIDAKDIPSHDILCGGFPCQAFSMAGKREGFSDPRGTLFYEIVRIAKHHKPKVIFCENVRGLLSHDKGNTMKVIVKSLEDIGYKVFYKVLNSANFGLAQNRHRVFIVCFREDLAIEEFTFPEGNGKTATVRDILEKNPVPSKYYISDVALAGFRAHKERHKAKRNGFGYSLIPLDSIANTLTVRGMSRGSNLIVDTRLTDFTPTTNIQGEINREYIRKFTPRECARLQGFPDTFKLTLADTHHYSQFGNSVPIPVVAAIAAEIRAALHSAAGAAEHGAA